MAESEGDKTEAPTPRRRQEAREQGNIARSTDLNSACILVGGLILLKWFGFGIITAMRAILLEMLGAHSLADNSTTLLATQALHCVALTAMALAPIFFGAVVIAALANLAQVGFIINFSKLSPNFAALNPVRGLKNFGGQGVMHLVMNFVKFVMVGLTAYSAVGNRLAQIVAAQKLSFIQIFGLGADIVYSIGMRVGILLLVLAILDYIYQRYRFEQSLRMTKMEVKEEMRSMNGDPLVRQRQRQIAIQRAVQRLKKDVPTADVIVVNPTHYAVALQYDEKTMRAPKLVAKGADYMAARIRELAIEAGLPIIERPPLARAIYQTVDVGQEIPEEFYTAVAEILAYVYALSRGVSHPIPHWTALPA
ncbi:MAG: flagellar biosynthesis protein FlhB [Planctomycetota bacterium]|nr:flagellar biosynthesis protein FlhB [Planctomycetota bacterium]